MKHDKETSTCTNIDRKYSHITHFIPYHTTFLQNLCGTWSLQFHYGEAVVLSFLKLLLCCSLCDYIIPKFKELSAAKLRGRSLTSSNDEKHDEEIGTCTIIDRKYSHLRNFILYLPHNTSAEMLLSRCSCDYII